MSKVNEFYMAAMANENAKAKLDEILADTDVLDASDDQLMEIGNLAKEMGYGITLEEAKDYLQSEEAMDVEILDAAAGGDANGTGKSTDITISCEGAGAGAGIGTTGK